MRAAGDGSLTAMLLVSTPGYWCPAVSVCVVFSVAGVIGGVADRRLTVPAGGGAVRSCTVQGLRGSWGLRRP